MCTESWCRLCCSSHVPHLPHFFLMVLLLLMLSQHPFYMLCVLLFSTAHTLWVSSQKCGVLACNLIFAPLLSPSRSLSLVSLSFSRQAPRARR